MGNTENKSGSDLAVIKNELLHISRIIESNRVQITSFNKTIYGYEERPGIFSRITSLESKVSIIWRAVGIFGAAVITVLIDIFTRWYKA